MSGLDLYLSQSFFLSMLVISAAAGLGLGLVYDFLVCLRVLLRLPRPRRETQAEAAGRDVSDKASDGSGESVRDPHGISEGDTQRICPPSPGFAGDLFFSLIVAVTAILLIYYTNDGVLRAPALVGLSVGFGCWYATVGRLLRRGLIMVAGWLRRLAGGLLLLAVRPFLWMGRLLRSVMARLWSRTVGKTMGKLRHALSGLCLPPSREEPPAEDGGSIGSNTIR